MRYIRKGPEPRSLLEYRLTAHADYEGLPKTVKDELREQLAREQGFLCCYCMRRIGPAAEEMKIEHWASQTAPATQHRQLDWKNLLGACKGGEGQPQRHQHCDTYKGDVPITVNPTDPACERLIRFLADGTVSSEDPITQEDLEHRLNLNEAQLKNNRKAALGAFLQAMRKKHPDGTSWPESSMRREFAELAHPDADGRLTEYCQVPLYWLKKRMGRSVSTPP